MFQCESVFGSTVGFEKKAFNPLLYVHRGLSNPEKIFDEEGNYFYQGMNVEGEFQRERVFSSTLSKTHIQRDIGLSLGRLQEGMLFPFSLRLKQDLSIPSFYQTYTGLCKEVASTHLMEGRSCFLYGGCNTGKTTLASFLIQEGTAFLPEMYSKLGYFISVGGILSVHHFLSLQKALISNTTTLGEKNKIKTYLYAAHYCPLLVVDDIGAERGTDWESECLLNLINSRYENCVGTIFTSNIPWKELSNYGERIASRIRRCCGCVVTTTRRNKDKFAFTLTEI